MFLVFTAATLWIGWNVHWVRERAAFLDSLEGFRRALTTADTHSNPASEKWFIDMLIKVHFTRLGASYKRYEPTATQEIGQWRTALGDQPYWLLSFFPSPEADAARARWLFPEAIILVADEPFSMTPQYTSQATP